MIKEITYNFTLHGGFWTRRKIRNFLISKRYVFVEKKEWFQSVFHVKNASLKERENVYKYVIELER